MSTLRAFVRLGRPAFLVYSWVLVTLGTAIALRGGATFSAPRLLQALAIAWTAHLMTHYVNEFFDLEADRANDRPTGLTGGSRVLVEGLLSPSVAIGAAVFLMLAMVAQILLLPGSAQAAAYGGLALGWAYTAPPFRLNYRGFGEVTVATVLLGLLPFVAGRLQAFDGAWPWLVVLPAFLVQAARMSVMNLADHDGDVQVGKRTLAVRLGPARARVLHAVGQGVALVAVAIGWAYGVLPDRVALCLAATAPLGLFQAWHVLRGADRTAADSLTFWATNHSAIVMVATLAGVLWDLAATSAVAPTVLLWLAPGPIVVGALIATRIAKAVSRAPAPAARTAESSRPASPG